MAEFITSISAPHNIVLTIMLCGCALYWAFVIVFGLGMEVMDGVSGFFHHAPDISHGHTGLETHMDGAGHTYSVTGAAFRFLNFGEIPATIILSIILLITWVGSVVTNPYTREQPFWIQIPAFLGVFIAALLLSKLITSPIKEVFANNESKGPPKTDLIGCECILTTSAGENRTGTAEAKTPASRFIIVHVRAAAGQNEIPKGARAVIVSVDPNAGGYLVALPGSPAASTHKLSEGDKTK